MQTITAWHGTNQAFNTFSSEWLGLNTSNAASAQAFFFARRPDTAWDYALKAARTMIPDQLAHEEKIACMIAEADRAQRRGDFENMERLYAEAEEIEAKALNDAPSGERILLCSLSIENPLHIDASDWAVATHLAKILADAKKSGYDAVILEGISDTPSGEPGSDDHIAVFSPDCIEITQVFDTLEIAEASVTDVAFEMSI